MSDAKSPKQRSAVMKWTRRSFLASAGLAGGGLALGLTLSPNRLAMTAPAEAGETMLNTWVKITPDNRVTVLFPHSEMGQGSGTGLAQMLAEELDADWDLVSIEQAPVTDDHANSDLGRSYIIGEGASIPSFVYPMLDFTFLQLSQSLVGQLTGGSLAIRLTGHHGMRRAGASAREMLMKAAADEWSVPVQHLEVANNVISHSASDRSATFGALAARAAAYSPNLKPRLKDSRTYSIVGQSKPRHDLPPKVNGTAQFGMDVTVPGMVYAAIALPEVRDARAVSVNDATVRQMQGVGRIINIGDAVAVTADSYWTASRALEALEIDWQGGQTDLSSAGIRETHRNDVTNGERESMDEAGDVDSALGRGDRLRAEFEVPYLAHATMEPMNCTVSVGDGNCEIWVGHQNMLFARNEAAEILGIDPAKVTMHPQYLGGGFGRRARLDFISTAVRVGRELDTPVKVIWSRETDMANDYYRPAILSHMEGSLENGRIVSIRHTYVDADSGMPDSERPFEFQYDVANRDIARVKCPSPITVGPWRSVDFTQMAFFNESFMDELAHAAGADPMAFRLAHTSDDRRRAVLQRLAEEADWGAATPSGRALGVALVSSFASIVGQVADVSVEDDGGVRVHRVISVVDCGRLINPSAGEAQIMGSVIYGLTSALFGEITVEGGVIQQRNFPDYEMLHMHNTPRQDVYFMDSDLAPGGLGEPGVPPVTPAVTNAIFRATGERILTLPIGKHGFYAV